MTQFRFNLCGGKYLSFCAGVRGFVSTSRIIAENSNWCAYFLNRAAASRRCFGPQSPNSASSSATIFTRHLNSFRIFMRGVYQEGSDIRWGHRVTTRQKFFTGGTAVEWLPLCLCGSKIVPAKVPTARKSTKARNAEKPSGHFQIARLAQW